MPDPGAIGASRAVGDTATSRIARDAGRGASWLTVSPAVPSLS